jgi:hypothetical protein
LSFFTPCVRNYGQEHTKIGCEFSKKLRPFCFGGTKLVAKVFFMYSINIEELNGDILTQLFFLIFEKFHAYS